MAKVIGSEQTLEFLVNCKTYPAVSKKYIETVCTGGVEENGRFVRLYPVPFRFLEGEEQYKRWDIIRVRVYRDTKDPRPESWHLEPGTKIERIATIVNEQERWEWMRKTVHQSKASMESQSLTNGCVEIEPFEIYWKPDAKTWTANQLNVFEQGQLYSSKEELAQLADRVPWEFRIRFREKETGQEEDLKILAWSLYAGFRRFHRRGQDEQAALQDVVDQIGKSVFNPRRTVFGIFGTHKRFGHWMISALYHVPTKYVQQGALF